MQPFFFTRHHRTILIFILLLVSTFVFGYTFFFDQPPLAQATTYTGDYNGTLNTDGNTVTGNVTQNVSGTGNTVNGDVLGNVTGNGNVIYGYVKGVLSGDNNIVHKDVQSVGSGNNNIVWGNVLNGLSGDNTAVCNNATGLMNGGFNTIWGSFSGNNTGNSNIIKNMGGGQGPCTLTTPPSSTTYTITGSLFEDTNKNGLKDAGEANHSGTPSISASRGTVTTNSDGTYMISNLTAGTVTISYTSLPPGYNITYPLNGPPPSFQVTVGPGCNANGANGATCQ